MSSQQFRGNKNVCKMACIILSAKVICAKLWNVYETNMHIMQTKSHKHLFSCDKSKVVKTEQRSVRVQLWTKMFMFTKRCISYGYGSIYCRCQSIFSGLDFLVTKTSHNSQANVENVTCFVWILIDSFEFWSKLIANIDNNH